MKSAKYSLTKFAKFVGLQTAFMVEAISTGICSIAAFACLFLLDGIILKLLGFVGFFALAYFVAWIIDKIKGEA